MQLHSWEKKIELDAEKIFVTQSRVRTKKLARRMKNVSEPRYELIGKESITAAYIEVFGQPDVGLMCYFHVVQNNEKFENPDKRRQMRSLESGRRSITTLWKRSSIRKSIAVIRKEVAKRYLQPTMAWRVRIPG